MTAFHDTRPSIDLEKTTITRAYSRWAAIYDVLCAPVFRPAHSAAAAAANGIGGHILEVGVGTGLLLPLYDRRLWVTGIDLSDEMLDRARRRLRSVDLPHVAALEKGDIHGLRHPDNQYDAIVLPFVLTLLADPELALANCRRMLRTGGEIIIVSHFRSSSPTLASIERWLAPRIARLGLRPDFDLERITRLANCWPEMEMLAPERVGPFGIYTLVRLRKQPMNHGGARLARLSEVT